MLSAVPHIENLILILVFNILRRSSGSTSTIKLLRLLSILLYLVGGVVYANGPKYSWLRNHRGEVPPAAVTLGQTKDGDPLFVGRAELGSGLYIGKVVPNQGLYIGLGGRSMFLDDYEILVE
ncbi:hypothetical protein GE061_018482 [Apolygus lucorum]|uniref:Uncharacterized protein n=1 Tax=Apolygus lucorum TaxID=248454 RepID=A0A8S9XG24_APOLU|nr:hypothetical protein GE061_018482 [Apolygus lucorum]